MSFLISLLILATQANTATPLNLAGKWSSTTKAAKGEAPMIAPSFVVEEKDGKYFVTLEGHHDPLPATTFQISRTEALLVLKTTAARGAQRMIIIRPLDANQVRFEDYIEYPEPSARRSYYYSEVFKRSP